jgi:hypothetical protein
MFSNNQKIRTLEDVKLTLSLKSSWDYHEFKQEFRIDIDDLTGFNDLFCIADQKIHVYDDAPFYEIEQFTYFLNSKIDPNTYNEDNNFNAWFHRFLKEKGLSETVIEIEDNHYFHHIPIKVIEEHLAYCTPDVQHTVNVTHFFISN